MVASGVGQDSAANGIESRSRIMPNEGCHPTQDATGKLKISVEISQMRFIPCSAAIAFFPWDAQQKHRRDIRFREAAGPDSLGSLRLAGAFDKSKI